MSGGLYFYECIVVAQLHRQEEEVKQQHQRQTKQQLQRVRNQMLFAADSKKKLSK